MNHQTRFIASLTILAGAYSLAASAQACGPQPTGTLASFYNTLAGGEKGPLGCMTEASSAYDLAEANGKNAGTRAVFEHGEIAQARASLSPFAPPLIAYVDASGVHVKFDSYPNAPAYEIGVGAWGKTAQYQYKKIKTPGANAVSGSADFPLSVIGTEDVFVRLVRCPKSSCNPEDVNQVAEVHIKRSMIPGVAQQKSRDDIVGVVTGSSSGTPTLKSIGVRFLTTDDDLDWDSILTLSFLCGSDVIINVQKQGSQWSESGGLAPGTHFGMDTAINAGSFSNHNTFPSNGSWFPLPINQGTALPTKPNIGNCSARVHIDPNGHDTWDFNYNVLLTFSDGSTMERDFNNPG